MTTPSFTLRDHYSNRRAKTQNEQEGESMRESIIDLETSIELHKDILREVICAKSAAFSLDGSSETDLGLLIPGRSFDAFLSENKHLESCIEWATRELEEIKDDIKKSELELLESKLIEDKRSQRILTETKDLKSSLRKQERQLQNLEVKASILEKEIEQASKSERNIDVDSVIQQMKKITRHLTRKRSASERECSELEVQLKEFEERVRWLRRQIRLSTKFELQFDQGHKQADELDLCYEGYFMKNKYQFDEVSDSINSSDFESTGLKLPAKVNVRTKTKPRLPRLDLSSISASNEESKMDSKPFDKGQAVLLELEYATRIKSEEIESCRKLLEYLIAQHEILAESLLDKPVSPQ